MTSHGTTFSIRQPKVFLKKGQFACRQNVQRREVCQKISRTMKMNQTEKHFAVPQNDRVPGVALRTLTVVATAMAVLTSLTSPLQAASISVPNWSFEAPETEFADPRNDSWQESPTPIWYDESANGPWDLLTGVFLNTAPTNSSHIDNMEGKQGAFFFALPGVSLFQDYNSTYGTNTIPTHDFNAKFEVAKSYQLTVGVIGGGGGMSNGVTMELSLYCLDGASNMVTVAATSITNTPTAFSNTTHFIDFRVQVPTVKDGDAWAGRNIGVKFLSTVGFDLVGGYWDLDNVRLESIQGPILVASAVTNDQFTITWQSEPGLRFEMLATTDISQPISNWASLGMVTNTTGTAIFTDATTGFSRRFYQARQLP